MYSKDHYDNGSSTKAKISILIPTYNEERTIVNKLDNTLKLKYPKEYMEIIISDSSTDRTAELIEEYFEQRDYPKLILHHEDERKGVSYADNIGVSLSSGDIIIRTDSDVLLDENAIINALESFKDETVGCVTGKPSPQGYSREKSYRNMGTKIQQLESRIDSTLIAHGPFTAFRRELFKPIELDTIADDSSISIDIRRQGFRCILNTDIIFYERTSEEGREEQKVRRASGLIKLLWRNKGILLNPKYGKYGFVIFPFNFFMIIFLPIILSPLLIILIIMNVKGGTLLETEKFLLKGVYRLLANKATIYWEQDAYIRR